MKACLLMFLSCFGLWSCAKDDINRQAPDVYVAGFGTYGRYAVGVYWKNDVPVKLEVGSVANAIAVVGADVYIAGTKGNFATYWRNGIATDLTNATQGGRVTSMAISGTDV